MLFIFGRNTLGMQRWDEIAGAVTGEAFDYLPNFEIVLDVNDVKNCCQEDDFTSSITLLALALHRLKIIISLLPSPFHSVEGMLSFSQQRRTAYSTIEQRF